MKQLCQYLSLVAAIFLSSGSISASDYSDTVYIEKRNYQLTRDPIDVVFVCHPKDHRTLELAIDGIRTNGENIGRIIVVSAYQFAHNAEWFDEALFPFNKETVALEIFNNDEAQARQFVDSYGRRLGWIYQQILKLYAPFIIPEISPNVLVIDADTIFLNPTAFIDGENRGLFNPGTEYHKPYFEHAARLLPGFKKQYSGYSGVSHHMLLQRPIVEDLFQAIENTHSIEPWRALLRCISHDDLYRSCLSEYEIYFNFAFSKTDQVKIRQLRWKNLHFSEPEIDKLRAEGYNYVSCHSYLKELLGT